MKSKLCITITGPTGSRKSTLLNGIQNFLLDQGLQPAEVFRNHGVTTNNEPWETRTWEWETNKRSMP